MKRFFFIVCLLTILFSGCKDTMVDIAIITDTAVLPEHNAATFAILVQNQNSNHVSMTVQEYGIYLSDTNTEPTDRDMVFKLTESNLDFDYNGNTGIAVIKCEGLTPQKTYYARPYIANSFSKLTGNVISFTTTGAPDDKITLTFVNISNVTATTVDVKGKITIGNDAAGKVNECGYFYSSTSSNPGNGDKRFYTNDIAGKAGTFSLNWKIDNLSPSTKYYIRMYYKAEGSYYYDTDIRTFTTSSDSPTPSGTTIQDFVGTYSMTAYSVDEQKYYSWNNVEIGTFNDSETGTVWVYVYGLNYGSGYALGEFDATYKAVKLYSAYTFSDATFTLQDCGDTLFVERFYPIYVNKTDASLSSWHAIIDGNGYDGTGEAFLTFNNSGKLVLGPAATADSKGYKANGYNFICYYADSGVLYGWYDAWVEATLTKTSSSASAPAKIPLKTQMQLPGQRISHFKKQKALPVY